VPFFKSFFFFSLCTVLILTSHFIPNVGKTGVQYTKHRLSFTHSKTVWNFEIFKFMLLDTMFLRMEFKIIISMMLTLYLVHQWMIWRPYQRNSMVFAHSLLHPFSCCSDTCIENSPPPKLATIPNWIGLNEDPIDSLKEN
jgi:hypothetical protein